MSEMWTVFRVQLDFVTRLCASVPGSSDLIKKWLEARAPRTRPPQARSLDAIADEVMETIIAGKTEGTGGPGGEGEPELVPLIFQRVDGRLAVRLSTLVRGHLKDCAYQVQTYLIGAVEGEKSFSVRFKNAIYWPPRHPLIIVHDGTPFVPILRQDGTSIYEPDGLQEKAVHFVTRQGPRSALKAFEYVQDARIEFPLAVLRQPARRVRQKTQGKWELVDVPGRLVVGEEDLKQVFLYGAVHGYGGERSEDGGRYAFTITPDKED